MKTIRELADEIGVSKQAIFKKMKQEPLSTSLHELTSTVDGKLTVTVDGEELIKQAFSKNDRQPVDVNQENKVDDYFISIIDVLEVNNETLRNQLEVKDKQIADQQQTIDKLTELLDTAQKLHAGTIQKQLLPKKWRFWKRRTQE